MNTVQNILLQQVALMAGGVSLPQVNADGGEKAGSFQEMMKQAKPENTETAEKPAAKEETAPAAVKDEEDLTDPNRLQAAYDALQMAVVFQQNIQPVEEEAELPEMAVETAAPVVQAEAAVETEILPEETVQQPESAPVQAEAEETPAEAPKTDLEVEQAAGRDAAPVETVKAERSIERPDNDREDDTAGEPVEAEVQQAPLFREVDSTPVKVGENYGVDTTAEDVEVKLAKTIQTAADAGSQRIEIRLNPDNLGALTVEMTRSSDGALQVVLHAANGKSADLLNTHLNGLTAALQGLNQNEVRVEVRQETPSSQQHPFQQADPDGRGRHHGRQERHENQEQADGGEDFLQQLRLGLLGS